MTIYYLIPAGRKAGPARAEGSGQERSAKRSQGKCLNGVFLGDGLPSKDALAAYARQSGKGAGLVMWFQALNYSFDFPLAACDEVAAARAIPFLKIEPWSCKGRKDPTFSLDKINSGRFDNRILRFGEGAACWGGQVLVSFGHEMNGDWYPWGGKPKEYVKAFNRFFDLCRQAGAANIVRVWNPNADRIADLKDYCPDEAQFDIVAFDGFNHGTTYDWSSWRSFEEIFRGAIEFAARQLPGKPVMIGEFASAERGGDKAAWITEAFDFIKSNGQVMAAVWFNARKEADWQFSSTQSSAAAYVYAVSDDHFIGSLSYPISESQRVEGTNVIPISSKRTASAQAVYVPDSLEIIGEGKDCPQCRFEVEFSGLPQEAYFVKFYISSEVGNYKQNYSVVDNNRATLTGFIHPDVAGEEQGRIIIMNLEGEPLLAIDFRLPFVE